MPSFLLKRIQELVRLNKGIEIFVVEYSYYGSAYVVQRNQIIDIIGNDHFIELGHNKDRLIDIIKENNIDIIHIDENVEMLNEPLSENILKQIYSDDRTWRIVETCHNIWFDANQKNDIILILIYLYKLARKEYLFRITLTKDNHTISLENKNPHQT